MLKINVVLVNGRLVGRTVSDRWNLEMIGYLGDKFHSQTSARKLARELGCMIVVHKVDQTITPRASKIEAGALGRKLSKLLAWVA